MFKYLIMAYIFRESSLEDILLYIRKKSATTYEREVQPWFLSQAQQANHSVNQLPCQIVILERNTQDLGLQLTITFMIIFFFITCSANKLLKRFPKSKVLNSSYCFGCPRYGQNPKILILLSHKTNKTSKSSEAVARDCSAFSLQIYIKN